MKPTRREFLATAALAATAPSFLRAEGAKLPLAFSTLGCPKWPWPQILDFAQAMQKSNRRALESVQGAIQARDQALLTTVSTVKG